MEGEAMYKLQFTLVWCCILLPVFAFAQEENCLSCHEQQSPMVVEQWQESKHGKEEVMCMDCHDPDISKTIVSDLHFFNATLDNVYIDLGGLGIETVFNQFLNDRSGPFNHLASGYLVDQH